MPTDPSATCTVLAARLQLSSWRVGPRTVLWAVRIHRRLRGFPGVRSHGFAVDVRGRALWTVSAWSTRSALVAFERSEHHAAARRELASHLTSSTFAVWDCDGSLLPVAWTEVRHRIREASRRAPGSS